MAKSAAERKRAERERKKAHLQAVGAAPFNMTMYRGTREALEFLMEAGGFDEPAEVITVLIHKAEAIARRDKSRFAELVDPGPLRRMAQ